MIKILITAYVAMESGHVSMNSVVVEAETNEEANAIIDNITAAERCATRVHYDAIFLN